MVLEIKNPQPYEAKSIFCQISVEETPITTTKIIIDTDNNF